ncbi:MAG TPA: zf-TFIIB domain-containing protein [Flavisolibacter sp.]|nr:zf-TFIIB domain-containing protein [Flavisolibacter sp.]
MKCPNCNETLIMADRQGVEIDYCPNCRGVWLDRGELDKIIERSAAYSGPPDTERQEDKYKQYPQQGGHHNDPYYKHKKKKGFLSDFFDFD